MRLMPAYCGSLVQDGYIVNIARGSVIDQAALVAALANKTIAGAGLDVYDREPQPSGELTGFASVVLTPHIGGHTLDSHRAMQGLRNRQPGGVFRRKAVALRGPSQLNGLGSAMVAINAATTPLPRFRTWQLAGDSLKSRFRMR